MYPRGNGIVSDIIQRAFGAETQPKDRVLKLTYMLLRQFIGTPMLDDCKVYWENHSTLISCFKDLRPFVQGLENKTEFYDFFIDAKVSGQVCIRVVHSRLVADCRIGQLYR